MLKYWFIVLAIWVCCLHVSTAASAQGTEILERAIAGAGGRPAWEQIKDFRATGSFSLYSRGEITETGNVALCGLGMRKFRLVAALSNETRTWQWNNGVGQLQSEHIGVDPIGPHNLAALENLTLPIRKIIGLLAAREKTIQLVESTTLEGRDAYRVRIVRTAGDSHEALSLGGPSFSTDVLVDQQTFVVLGIEDTLHPNTHTRDSFQHRMIYSDYRLVEGVQVPFFVGEEITGQRTWALQLESFQPNQGVSDSEFTIK